MLHFSDIVTRSVLSVSWEEHPGLSMAAHPGLQLPQVGTELGYYPMFFCNSLDLWLMSHLLSNIILCLSTVVWNSHTFPSCQTLDCYLPFLSVAHAYWSVAQRHTATL